MKHYPKGLDGRQRDRNGEIRQKRGDTLVKTLREQYGEHVAPGYRSDTKLETIRQDTGESLGQIIKK